MRAVTVTCERWLWAPRSEIFFEQGHRLVTGTTTLTDGGDFAVADVADEGDVVVHQALHAGNRRRLVDEVREVHLDVAGFGFQLDDHVAQHRLGKFSTEISRSWPLRISTKRDMCVPLKLCGRPTYMLNMAMVCCTPPLLVLHLDRVADGLDADLVDRRSGGCRREILDVHGRIVLGLWACVWPSVR